MFNLQQKDTCYYFLSHSQDTVPQKVAAFDLDDTIITTKSKSTFAKDANDWTWLFPEISPKLHELVKDGYHIVIFTNQKGIGSGKTELSTFTNKLTQILNQLPPVDIFISSEDDYFRKPMTGMWQLFTSLYPDSIIDKEHSFYCGDAAGRPKDWNGMKGRSKDFSSSDRYFAHNIGLQFYIPELFVLKKGINLDALPPHPLTLVDEDPKPIEFAWDENKPVMILMVGAPASGKSHFSKQMEEKGGFVRINQDTLKTSAKCLKAAKEAIKNRQNIIIDNTNASISGRKQYLDLISGTDYVSMALEMSVPKELAKHLNYYRVETSKGAAKKIADVVYNVFYKKFEKPTEEEGFKEVMEVPFARNVPGTGPEMNYYYQ